MWQNTKFAINSSFHLQITRFSNDLLIKWLVDCKFSVVFPSLEKVMLIKSKKHTERFKSKTKTTDERNTHLIIWDVAKWFETKCTTIQIQLLATFKSIPSLLKPVLLAQILLCASWKRPGHRCQLLHSVLSCLRTRLSAEKKSAT